MKHIEFNVMFEGKMIHVELSSALYGGDSFDIVIDRRIHGCIVRYSTGWMVFPTWPPPSNGIHTLLYSDDFLALRDIVEDLP